MVSKVVLVCMVVFIFNFINVNASEGSDFKYKLLKQAKLYGRMIEEIKKQVHQLSNEQRSLLSVAYEDIIGAKLSSWRTISYIVNETINEANKDAAIFLRDEIEKELRDICKDVLSLLDNFLIPKANDPESKVFYLKMKGDYYRYLAEVATGDERSDVISDSQKAYQEAFEIATKQMKPTHPIRLGVALNILKNEIAFNIFNIATKKGFKHDRINKPEYACELAKQEYSAAIAKLDSLDETSYNESILIVRQLADNLKFCPCKQLTSDYGDNCE